MKTWYVKEFGKLTQLSVRTLHHYDDIGLLKPSFRSSSDYRLYSEVDLLKLERITALKFFGFSLKQIMDLVGDDAAIVQHLKAQQACLVDQIAQLHQATEAINALIAKSTVDKSPDWSKIVALIKVYRMTKTLKESWAQQVYSPDQLKQFAALNSTFTEERRKDIENRWAVLIAKVKSNLDQDPSSALSQRLAKEWMALVDENFGNYEELKDAVSMAYKHNKIPNAPFDKAIYDFIEKAVKHLQSNKKS